jgi:ADP-ribose pyrophosphatase YjhB (NUDIX family)
VSRAADLVHFLARAYWRIAHPLTVGVRVMLVGEDGILLVRHVYGERQWYLPGGGVKKGETLLDAARREAREEVHADVRELALIGVYSTFNEGKSDHIAVFASLDFALGGGHNAEIAELRFYQPQALPNDVSPGTKRRVEELAQHSTGAHCGDW